MGAHTESPARIDPAPDGLRHPVTGLGRIAARGAAVTLGGQGIRMIVQVASVIVLAKLLTPHDYGVVAMVLAVAGIADIFRDFGLSSAAVQARSLSPAQRDNLFWLNSGLGLALCLIVAGGSPLIAGFFHEPAVRNIAMVLSLTFLVNGLATQYRADLDRHLRFGQLAVIDIGAQIAGLVIGVTFAVNGAGYWALVAQQLLNAALTLVAVVVLAGWLPRRPTRGAGMSGLLRFGWHLVGTQLIGYATNNVDSVVIGHRFGAVPLGYYNRAFQLLMAPLTQMRAPTTTVALPVLSRIESDNKRYGAFLVRGQIGLGYTLVVGLAVASAAAQPIVELCLGPRWAAVTPILRILAFAGATTTLSYAGYWVFLSRGLTRELLRYTAIVFLLRVVCVLLGSLHGIIGVAIGYAVAPTLAAPLSLWWLSRRTFLPLRALLSGYFRILIVAVAAAGSASGLLSALPALHPVFAVALATFVVPAVYLLAALTVPAVRSDLTMLFEVAAMIVRKAGSANAVPAGAVPAGAEGADVEGADAVGRAPGQYTGLVERLGSGPVIGLGAFVVSVLGSWIPSVWSDEGATMAAATRTWGQLWTLVRHVDIVHALYYALMHAWFDLVGVSAFTLRLPSAVAVGIGAAGVVVLGRRLHSASLGATAGVLFAFLPRVTWMGIEGRSSALATGSAVWVTVLFLRALDGHRSAVQTEAGGSVPQLGRARRIRWWIGYALACALGVTLSIYFALLVIAHGVTLLISRRPANRMAGWAGAAIASLLLASPIIVLAKRQSAQVGWIRQTGLKSVKSVLIDQWFGTYGAKSAPLALAAWLLIGFGLYGAFRRRSATSSTVLERLALPWLALPTALLFGYSLVGTPLYTAKYLAFCSPAVALLLAAGIGNFSSRGLRRLAVVAVVALALPSYAFARQPTAKDGSDWKLAAARIAAHDERGDCVLFGNLYNSAGVSRGSARSVKYSYPAAFAQLRDVEADGLSPPAEAVLGSSEPFIQSVGKLGGADRVWVVYDHSKLFTDPANADRAALVRAGYRLSRLWRGSETDVVLMGK